MILFRLISWPYARKHALRSLLTLAGIAIGVAAFVSMHLANAAVLGSFTETVTRIAGATQLQITAGEPGFSEDLLERVQDVPGVRVAVPIVEAIVGTNLPGQGNLLILGVDMTGDRSLRDYAFDQGDDAVVDDPLVFLAQPDSLIVTSQFAAQNQVKVGAKIPLVTSEGERQFTVRGILKSGGLNSAFGGNLAIMDVYSAQFVFGRGRKFDRIDLAGTDGTAVDALQASLQQTLGPGFDVEPPATRGRSFESLSRIYSFMLKFSSAFALVIGMFIIYNSFAIAVTQRRKEIGILRALGATRAQIGFLFVIESAVAGTIGSAIGLAAGSALANLIANGLGQLLEGIYGTGHVSGHPVLSGTVIGWSFLLGVTTSVVAAVIPARAAAGVDPVKALQKGQADVVSARESRLRWIAALLLGPSSIALLVFSKSLAALYAAYAGTMTAALLLAPQLAVWTTRALRPVLRWLRPVEGALAADSLIGAPRRTSATVAALMFSIALVVGLAGSSQSAYANITEWVNNVLNPDFFVSTSPTMVARDYRFPESMRDDIVAVDGVSEAYAVRNARIRYGGGIITLISVAQATDQRYVKRAALEGDIAEMRRLVSAGQGVIASENLSALQNVHVGTMLELRAPQGLLRIPVVGVVREYSDQQGSIFIDPAVYQKWWDDTSVDLFRVYLKPGAAAAEVRKGILAKVGSNRRLFVLANEEVRNYVMGLTNQWFNMTWIQLVVAIFVAIMGIINALTVSIADRRREFGILRAVGGLGLQIRGTVWIEAITIGLVGLVLGLAVGAIQLFFQLQISARDYPGMILSYLYPFGIALMLVPLIIAVAFLASVGPAEAAARGSLVEALEYE